MTARCFRNEVMSRDYAKWLFQLVTGEFGVPLLRVVSPTLDGAAHPPDAAHAADRLAAVLVFSADESGRTGKACISRSEEARELGY